MGKFADEMALRSMMFALVSQHFAPKATVEHPKGVIVPGDEFMTEKLRDPDYVPYCMVKTVCGRVRRVADGFECPTCGNKMNYDLTHYNGNVNVQYSAPAPNGAAANPASVQREKDGGAE